MSQSPAVMAFRKRLRSYGYSQISITQKIDENDMKIRGLYVVKAVEPLAGTPVEVEYSLERMRLSFR